MGQSKSRPSVAEDVKDNASSVHDSASSLAHDAKEDTQQKRHSRPRSEIQSMKRKLTRFELRSLHQVFDDLKTVYPDHFECIETKRFLEHLNLPSQVESAGILLFKVFSYLGSYPCCQSTGPAPLTFDAFITAFVVLTGRIDEAGETTALSETLLLEALAVIPESGSVPDPSPQTDTTVSETETSSQPPTSSSSKGLSLAELGITFDDLDAALDTPTDSTEPDSGPKLLRNDLIQLLVLLFWIVLQEPMENEANGLHTMAEWLLCSMPSPERGDDDLPVVSQTTLLTWQKRNAPALFKSLHSFLNTTFATSVQSSVTTASDILVARNGLSPPDFSELWERNYVALSWCLPAASLAHKPHRLYSANQDGFAMNRFERYVFRYPGPTLLLIQAEIPSTGNTLVLAVYIPIQWKQTRSASWAQGSFLVDLTHFEVYWPTDRNDHYIFHDPASGLGFGGTSRSLAKLSGNPPPFMLSIDNTLQNGWYNQEAYPDAPTFAASSRAPFCYRFETVNIELFGLGDDKARLAQERHWKFEAQEAERRNGLQIRHGDGRTVDHELLRMAGLVDDN